MATHAIFVGRSATQRDASNLRHGTSPRLLAGDRTPTMDARVSRTDDANGKAMARQLAATAPRHGRRRSPSGAALTLRRPRGQARSGRVLDRRCRVGIEPVETCPSPAASLPAMTAIERRSNGDPMARREVTRIAAPPGAKLEGIGS
jgi:hypothetical protein